MNTKKITPRLYFADHKTLKTSEIVFGTNDTCKPNESAKRKATTTLQQVATELNTKRDIR